jgi:transposase
MQIFQKLASISLVMKFFSRFFWVLPAYAAQEVLRLPTPFSVCEIIVVSHGPCVYSARDFDNTIKLSAFYPSISLYNSLNFIMPHSSSRSIAIDEPRLHPAIKATSSRRQTTSFRRAGRQVSDIQCGRIFAYLELGWKPAAIAAKVNISTKTIQRMEQNLHTFGSMRPPQFHTRGRPYKMTLADEDALLEYLLTFGWRTQDEMAYWLEQERCVKIDRSNISKMLQRRKWNRKEIRRISMTQNEELREAFQRDMSQFQDSDLVFLDESIFNEKTGWRHRAYAPVGQQAQYVHNMTRGETYSIIATTVLDGWLSCTAVKKGYYSKDQFIDWLKRYFIPTVRAHFQGRTPVIVLDNCSIHTNPDIEDVLEAAGFIVQYLPPYSPDFNPIELTFSVLKAWIRRNWIEHRESFSTFEDFLWFAIEYSECDKYIRKQFRHAAGGVYCEDNNLREFYRFLERWERDTELNLE